MITAGIDCGAKNTKAIILKDGKIIGKGQALTGFEQAEALKASSWTDAGFRADEDDLF